jgi:hypothetical protein
LPDLFSYFRRRRTTAVSRKPGRRPPPEPVADQEAIHLASMGGVISTVYLDIASVPARAPAAALTEKPRGRAARNRAADAIADAASASRAERTTAGAGDTAAPPQRRQWRGARRPSGPARRA